MELRRPVSETALAGHHGSPAAKPSQSEGRLPPLCETRACLHGSRPCWAPKLLSADPNLSPKPQNPRGIGGGGGGGREIFSKGSTGPLWSSVEAYPNGKTKVKKHPSACGMSSSCCRPTFDLEQC